MFAIRFKKTALLFALLLTVISVVSFLPRKGKVEASVRFTVLLDAGHGGPDGGVPGRSGVKESDLNLAVTAELQKLLQGAGFSVVCTRKSAESPVDPALPGWKKKDMQKRREIAQKTRPDLLLSVHMNSCPSAPSRSGGQVFYAPDSAEGKKLATCIQMSLNAIGKRNYAPLAGDYYMLKCTNAPSCIVECGFLSNAEEEALLCTEKHRQKVAQAIFRGICAYLGGT